MRFLTPTDNKRLNELIGFLCITLAVLTGLALSDIPAARHILQCERPRLRRRRSKLDWPGRRLQRGLSLSNLRLCRVPVAGSAAGGRHALVPQPNHRVADRDAIGYVLLLLSLPCLLCLWSLPAIRGAVPPGGLIGSVISNELRYGFNMWGANLLVIAILITALFMTTRFSFTGAHEWAANSPLGGVAKLNILSRVQARWHGWRDSRENDRMRRRLQETRTSGRKAVNQATGKQIEIARDERGGKTAVADEEEDEAKTIQSARPDRYFRPLQSREGARRRQERKAGR